MNVFFKSLLIFIVSLSLLTCGEEAQDRPEKQSKAPEPKILWEDLDDPGQWDEPRIQIVGSPGGQYEPDVIMSMKRDGSDLRYVWSLSGLSKEHYGHIRRIPVRSPDNRYIAMSIMGQGLSSRLLVDLKTKNYVVMDLGVGPAAFVWTADSNNVIFYTAGDLKKYNVETQKLTHMPDNINGRYFAILKDQKTILAARPGEYVFYDLNTGRTKKTVKIDNSEEMQNAALSPDETLLYYRDPYIGSIVNIKDGSVVLSEEHRTFEGTKNKSSIPSGIFSGLDNKMLYYRREHLWIFDPFTKTKTKTNKSEQALSRTTLINKKALFNQ